MEATLEPMRRAELLQKQVDDQLRHRAFGSPTQVGEVTIATPDQVGRDIMSSSTPIGVSASAKEVVVPPSHCLRLASLWGKVVERVHPDRLRPEIRA